jgi:hypothetical protein
VLLAVLARPWFVALIILAFQGLLILVNAAKYQSLREVFVYQDFDYFTDAIKHPRLYLPFFGIWRTVFATIGFGFAFAIGMFWETPIYAKIGLVTYITLYLICIVVGVIMIRHSLIRNSYRLTFDPDKDLVNCGQIASFWLYWQAEVSSTIANHASPYDGLMIDRQVAKPDIILIQSESFFDPRSLFAGIKREILTHFDQANEESIYSGRFKPPAWGANTVRTECAVLTGLSEAKLGIHRFNPYRYLVKQTLPNLVAVLKHSGYRTLCIHPYPASFYLRHKVFPQLGFDEFIDIEAFEKSQIDGQYIGDKAIADKVEIILKQKTDQPLFIFAITMENHGPLHLEKTQPEDVKNFYHEPPPANCDDLTVYLRHLNNADKMISALQISIGRYSSNGILAWYGDHVPIMPNVYDVLAYPDGRTDYFIWANDKAKSNRVQEIKNIPARELGMMLIEHINSSM